MKLKRFAMVGATAVMALSGLGCLSSAQAAGSSSVPLAVPVHMAPGAVHPDITAGCSVDYSTHEADGFCDNGSEYYGEIYYIYVQACNVDGCENFRGNAAQDGESTTIANVGSNWFVEKNTAWFDFE
jgi:hypothetical protein